MFYNEASLGCSLMKPDNDFVSMILVSANRRTSIPVVKKKGSKGGFSGVVSTENTPMLKSAKVAFEGILLRVKIQNSYMPFT